MQRRIRAFRIEICEYKNPPLKTRNGLLKIKGNVEVIICPENLSGVNYKDWQAIGQVRRTDQCPLF